MNSKYIELYNKYNFNQKGGIYFSTKEFRPSRRGPLEIHTNGRVFPTRQNFILHLLRHHNFIMVSHSSLYGVIVKMSLVGSPIHIVSNTSTINSLLFKFVVLHNTERRWSNERSNKHTETFMEFVREVHTQDDIWRKSMNDGFPICPGVFGAYRLNERANIDLFLDKLTVDLGSDRIRLFNEMKHYFRNDPVAELGIIIMENGESFSTLASLHTNTINNPRSTEHRNIYNSALKKSLACISRLHKLGYIHGDLHQGNVICGHDEKDASFGLSGRAYVIDFGRTKYYGNKVSCAANLLFNPIIELRQFTDVRFQLHDSYQWLLTVSVDMLNKAEEYEKELRKKVKDTHTISDIITTYPSLSIFQGIEYL